MGLNRSVESLNTEMQAMVKELIERCERIGIKVKVGEARRSMATQALYYLRGRIDTRDQKVIEAMQILGSIHAWSFSVAEIKKKVTWTLESNHLDGNAVDILVHHEDGQIDWSGTSKKWKTVLEIARDIGFVCGADWKQKDYPHLERR